MPFLDEDASEGTKDLVVRDMETVEVRRLAQIPLALEGNRDLIEFGLNLEMFGREVRRESTGSILVALLLNKSSR